MKLSEKAWEISYQVVEAIKLHPFNQELMYGTLALDKFAYYIEQDTLYLQDFARCHAIIASKVPLEYVRCFLRYSDSVFIAEQEVVHHFFKKTFNFQETGLLTPATLGYTSYLLRVCSMDIVEIGIAAILPCFWVYREVGLNIAKDADQHNPFARWIETYASDEFGAEVNEAIGIFNELAAKASDKLKSKMLDAFYKSTCLEWHFWNDAYNKTVFDNFDTKLIG